ncbi:MAG: Uma2 family endonuclease [Planctomycetota bacterium]
MSSTLPYQPHYTVADYQQWDGDWELWNGVAVARSPSPFGRHGMMLMRLGTALTNAIDRGQCRATVLAEIDWIISDDTVVRPDISVVCGPPPEGHIESYPAVVVEVLSESTRERDLTHKRKLYQQHLVPWYIIGDPFKQSVTILRRKPSGEYETVNAADEFEITLCGHCKALLDLRWLHR